MQSKIEIIEKSFEKIKLDANEFAASFYENLFAEYPEVKPLFANTDIQKQQKKLLDALILIVENLRHPEILKEVVQALGTRHINYGVLQQHYPLVGKALLKTLKQYLGEYWTPEVKAAWIYAYRGMAKLMLQGANYPPEKERSPTTETTETETQTKENPHIKNTETEVQAIPTPPPQPTPTSPIKLIETSFEKIKPRGAEFAASFYENLFAAYPEAKPLFANTDIQQQEKKLLNSLVLVVESLRQPEVLAQVLRALGARHINYGTLPQHYSLVGEAFLKTLEQYLQQDWNSELKNAWVFAYEQIVQLMFEGAGYSPETSNTEVETTSQ
ncbi:globin family protein, partial [Okeania sp. SIO2C9]|uniref:globin family protein n=1 Tax=Okeania sp. SIO2C9 TaxID=2607791 RepID=UPI0025D538CC